MSTQFPGEIIAVLPLQNTTGLYFLDIDLNCEIDAYKLAGIIRDHDPRAFIAIVTGDVNSQATVFKHAVEAMDYIIKGTPDFEERIESCIKIAHGRHIANTTTANVEFTIKLADDADTPTEMLSRGTILHLNSSDVIYVESLSSRIHHIYYHMRDKRKFLVRKTLKEVEKELGAALIRCHVSCLVNKAMISTLDPKARKLQLVNGQIIDIGRRHLKNFLPEGKKRKRQSK
jgi:two-component system response regulator AgrA